MAPPRFYCPIPLAPGARLQLPEAIFRHAVQVLRLPEGAPLTLFDGQGGYFDATIDHIDRNRLFVRVGPWIDQERESRLPVRLVQALQAGDKMDYTIQKAVELGVTAISPVVSRRSVVRPDTARAAKRVAHWRGIVASACEQCGRNRLPGVDEIVSLDHWLAQPAPDSTLRLLLYPEAAAPLAGFDPPSAVELLIGAEGGLDGEEVEAARLCGFIPVKLGPRILRTETAAVAALGALQALWGDFAGSVGEAE